MRKVHLTYDISVSDDGTYIIIKFTGTINRKIVMESNLKSHALGKELGINKFLSDMTDSVNDDSLLDNYNFTHEDLQTPEIDRYACVAIVVDPDDHSHDFIEVLARNTGHDITLFRNMEEAITHLKKD